MQILLDGYDMAAVDIDVVRRQMAYVSQEPQLFSTTIADNIARGDCTRIVSDVRHGSASCRPCSPATGGHCDGGR